MEVPMRPMFVSSLLLCLAGGAAVQTASAAPPPARAASQATAPTSPVTRALEGARADESARPEPAALPQVAVPLKRGTPPNPVAVKTGRAAPTGGSIDDAAARCSAAASAPDGCARAGRPIRP
jgi:hypothetical protein